MLEVNNLSKIYEMRKHWYCKKEQRVVFEKINFTLKSGENLMLLGKSGAGKSTLARILCFLETPSTGKVLYKQKNIHKLEARMQKKIRQEIQYIFQDQKLALNPYRKVHSLLLDGFDNFALPKDEGCINTFFDIFQLPKKILQQKPLELSGGEAMRVGLIRALLLQPSVLILDELSSSLDIKNVCEIVQFLKNYQSKQRISYIFITHQSEFFENFSCYKIKL
ncbi:ATP-binding cassette domain-containing protein [Campylobacter sp. MIT 21-1685]|uniref:ATP-binding cassette domain-containing protein n=1 Tax=unclassified Campylobacter TaxID=2593542 RepID=UPI00224B10B6|nr:MULTISPECIES: ATP-binding cassette domain-containing protein [unclassified Campylobacter]MCX2682671.1 ATP-binding cassette domain-containing protein [Campylobacter sp. MIT 21-1684]MCX2750951.1 ATP-binding cassette domain-containing protein [Campylobacter sp. MIT 21-1682]MCX2807116.1 ATP-binding cassette domain-containing protein [Campylobacter sp. MIT 21-1685]